ncbi:MAG: hypothetical protein FJ303_04390 [Planctomycetes bacterium]|nr:hypothetical protein [Planctomycetota bacterium]
MSNQHFSAPAANGSAESPMDEVVVVCPHCCEPTNDLKSLDVPYILFLFLYIAWTRDRVVACPNCMQQTLLKRTLFFRGAVQRFIPDLGTHLLLPVLRDMVQRPFRHLHRRSSSNEQSNNLGWLHSVQG